MTRRWLFVASLCASCTGEAGTGTDTDSDSDSDSDPRVMFEEDFNQDGLPQDWSQESQEAKLAWEHSASEGVASSGAALAGISSWFSDQEGVVSHTL